MSWQFADTHGALRAALLDWARTGLRSFPWRTTRDPWRILVSEVMLQQTQADRVVPYFMAFTERFPNARTCAAAEQADVIRLWGGLGYNRRAVNLHRSALAIVDHHGGRVPDDLEALLDLPGVGPYTARAVLAFAFERPAAVVDVNAARVLSRAAAVRPLTSKEAQVLADDLLPQTRVWDWNQAMLDVGARFCAKRRPRCEVCPLARACTWSGAGRPQPDPAASGVAATPAQPRFSGSDRQGRGRLVDALRAGPVPAPQVATAAGWPDDDARAGRIADALVAEGIVQRSEDGTLRLA